MNLNKIILIGRLAKDPDLKYTTSGIAVAKFRLAVSRSFANQKGEKETDFIEIVVWRKQAEAAANYLVKGKLVAVEGRLQIRSYDDKEGTRKWVSEVVAENVRFLEKIEKQEAREETASPIAGTEVEMSEEDLPF